MPKETVVFDFSEVKVGYESPFKIVNEYDLNGKFIKSYSSMSAIANTYNVSSKCVWSCCKRITLYVDSLQKIFLYAGESIEVRLNRIRNKGSHKVSTTPVREYLLNGSHVKTWPSVSAATKAFGISRTDLMRCLEGKSLFLKSRIFLWKMEKIEDRIAAIERDKQEKADKESFKAAYKQEQQVKVYTSNGEYLSTCKNRQEAAARYDIPISNIDTVLEETL